MYPVSSRFLDTVSGTHKAVVVARLVYRWPFSADPDGTDLPILTGDVKYSSTADVKSTLDITVPGDFWDAVQPFGAEIWAARGVAFGDGTSEVVPLGYFRIDTADQDNAPFGPVQLTGSDRTASIQQNRVLFPYQVPDGTTHRVIFERLVNGRLTPTSDVNTAGYAALSATPIPIVWTGYDPDRAIVTGGQVVEDSTYDFLSKLADGKDCVLRFDELGRLQVEQRDVDPDAAAVYAILPGQTGNLVKASRKTTRESVYNICSAYGSDPAAPTGYQVAYITDKTSPLRWDGQFAPSPRYYASPLLRDPAGAADAAASILSRYTGLPTTLGLFTVPNPALRPQDMVSAKITGLTERHVIDEVTIPLAVSGAGPVEIATKTTNQVIIPEPPDIPDDGTGSGGPAVPTAAQIAQEKAFQLTSTAENSTVNWWEQFSYLEDIGDERGYTCGIFGATSATGDLLALVQSYVATKPSSNVLAPFVPGLQTCANAGQGGTATSLANSQLGATFKTAWATAATDPVFQTAQINFRNQEYWTPAFNIAVADGMSYLGTAVYYDTCINHGFGSPDEDDGSFDDIHTAADVGEASAARLILVRLRSGQTVEEDFSYTGNPSVVTTYNGALVTAFTSAHGSYSYPADVTSGAVASFLEGYWLNAFLNAREDVLEDWDDAPVDGRVPMFRALIATGNYALTCLFSWSVYGDSFTMTVDPTPYGFVSGGTGTGSTTFPTPGVAHNIGSADGQNSFNIGVGFDGDATYGTAHHDFSRDEIEAGLNIPGYYELNSAGEVLMSAHPGGGKTSNNTKYPRVEYRELERDGSTKMSFDPREGRHYIKGRSAADSLSTVKPQMVLAQMHNDDDDTAMIYVNDATHIIAKVNGTTVATLDAAYVLGTLKDWMIEIVDGTINFYWNDLTTPAHSEDSFSDVSAGQYFKAGAYEQWNLDNGDATIGKVRLVNLEHWHSISPQSPNPWPAPARPASSSGGTTGSGGSTGTGSTGSSTTSDDGVEAAKLLGWGAIIDGDEFAYTGAPNSRWSMYDGEGHDGNGTRDPSAFSVANGVLTCSSTANGSTGGMAFDKEQKFCRVEWRVRTYSINPKGSGNRYHPVLIYWPTSDEWPQGGEFDYFECDNESGKYEAYLHIPGNDGSDQEYVSKQCDISTWHNVAFEWSSSGIKGWLDGQQVFSYPGFKQPPGTMHQTFQSDNFFGSSGMEPAKFEAMFFRMYASPS